MLRPEIEGEVAQGGFGDNGLASAAGRNSQREHADEVVKLPQAHFV